MKAEFLTHLDSRKISENPKKALLLSPLIFQSAYLNKVLEAPKGFVTDYASVPNDVLLRGLFGGIGDEGAVVHDYLYQTHLTSKTEADEVFLEAMKSLGVSWWRRYDMYWGVKLFGFPSYKSGPKRIKILNPTLTCLVS